MRELTRGHLISILDYNPADGIFRWKQRPVESFYDKRAASIFNSRFAEKIAGSITAKGYRNIDIYGRSIRAHRLAFFYLYGEWPELQIDHINGIRDDNRMENLRLVTGSENMKNSGIGDRNTSGFIGVTWKKSSGKWVAQARDGKKNIHIGTFSSFDDAVRARENYNASNGFHPLHGKKPALSRASL